MAIPWSERRRGEEVPINFISGGGGGGEDVFYLIVQYALSTTSPLPNVSRFSLIFIFNSCVACVKDETKLQGRVVQSWVKITQSYRKIWIQIWKLKKHFRFNSFCLQVDDWKL